MSDTSEKFIYGVRVTICPPGIAQGAEFQGNLRRPHGRAEQLIRVNDIDGSGSVVDPTAPEKVMGRWARSTPQSNAWGGVESARRDANKTKSVWHGKNRA